MRRLRTSMKLSVRQRFQSDPGRYGSLKNIPRTGNTMQTSTANRHLPISGPLGPHRPVPGRQGHPNREQVQTAAADAR
jgi:hypothetical protein